MAEAEHDEQLKALADELIARATRFLRELTATDELDGAAARIAEAEQARADALRRLADAESRVRALEGAIRERDSLIAERQEDDAPAQLRQATVRLAELEAEIRALRDEHQREAEALRAKLADAEQGRSEALRRAAEAEGEGQAREAAVPGQEGLTAAGGPVALEEELDEREALVEELKVAISAQRDTIARRDRALAEQSAQLEVYRLRLASLGATV